MPISADCFRIGLPIGISLAMILFQSTVHVSEIKRVVVFAVAGEVL